MLIRIIKDLTEQETMSKKLENAIIISGRCYELVNDTDGDECERCAISFMFEPVW